MSDTSKVSAVGVKTIAHFAHMCDVRDMDTTIRNLDEQAYRALKARAALAGRTIGDEVNDAIRAYLARPDRFARNGSLSELRPQAYPDGNERLSEVVDDVAYGI